MPIVRPCLDCGALTAGETRCGSCQSKRDRAKNRRSPYQSRAWRLIRAARRAAGGTTCAICGSDRYVAQHHAENVTDGGALEGETVPLCASCHSRYEAHVRAGRTTHLRQLVDALVGIGQE